MIHVETWQDLPITNEETLDKSADSARLDRRRGSASPPPSGEAAQMAGQLFSRSSSPHGRTATIHSVDEAHAASPLAAGDAGAALGRGHRHPPLSRTASSIPLSASSSCPRVTVLPSLRSCQSQFRRLTRFQSSF